MTTANTPIAAPPAPLGMISVPVVYPQNFGYNRAYSLPTATIPNVSVAAFQPQPQFYTATYSPQVQVPWLTALVSPQYQQKAAEQEQFYKQSMAYAQEAHNKVVPIKQQRSRRFEDDTFFYDERYSRSQNPNNKLLARGPGFYSIDELQLIPLQRLNAAAAASQGAVGFEGQFVAVTESGSSAPPTVTATASMTGTPQGSHAALQWYYYDAPQQLLIPEQTNYLAGIWLAYSLLSGLSQMSTELQNACRPFDVNEDTIAVVETQLETLLYGLTEKQQNNVKPLLYVFPLHDRYMSPSLRIFVYGEIVTDSRTGFKRALTTLSPFTWRHALPTGANRFRERGESISEDSDDFKMRVKYHAFLVKLYSMMWRTLMRLRTEQTALYSPEFIKTIDNTLLALKPASQSVCVLEARVRAIAARFQLLSGKFFNTAQFYADVDALKSLVHPLLLKVLARYMYFKLV